MHLLNITYHTAWYVVKRKTMVYEKIMEYEKMPEMGI
jgi:hypothetical protein